MSNKTYNAITTVLTALAAAGGAVISMFNIPAKEAIIASLPIIVKAVDEVLWLFVKDKPTDVTQK